MKRRLKKGDAYYIRYYDRGKVRWLAAGGSKRAAERLRDVVGQRVREGQLGMLRDKSDWTFSRLAGVYLARMAKEKPRSQAWRRDRVNQIEKAIGELSLEELDLGVLDRFIHGRLAAGKSVATVNGEVAIIRHAVGCAVRWRGETGLQEHRLLDWRPLKGAAREARFLDKKEVAAIREQSALIGGPCHVFVELFLATGARPGELLRLKAEDLKLRTVRLPALKGGVPRTVVVDQELVDRAAIVLHDWTHQKVRSHWRRVRKAAGVGQVRFYDLRHTVASEMLRRGATIRDVQRLLGHQTARMTERYAHFAINAPVLEGLKWH